MTDIIETTTGIRCQMCGVVNWPTAPACMRCTAALDKRPVPRVLPYSFASEKSFSQKVARVFEIADYVMLGPGICGVLLSLLLIGSAPWFPLIITAWFTAGCFLLSGFFRHSRGRLNDAQVSVLWRATIAYNLIEMVVIWWASSFAKDQFFYIFSLWPIIVVVLSAIALGSERNKRNSYSY